MVQPVAISVPAPGVADESITWIDEVTRWLPTNLSAFPAVAGDVTSVNPSGTPQAFALSLADVVRLSTPEGGFPNPVARRGARSSWWWLRTPGPSPTAANWGVAQAPPTGRLHAHNPYTNDVGGVRPALIINPN